eukprot:966698-Rhodomonas_salina.4
MTGLAATEEVVGAEGQRRLELLIVSVQHLPRMVSRRLLGEEIPCAASTLGGRVVLDEMVCVVARRI